MDPELLERTLNALFPHDQEETTSARILDASGSDHPPPPVTALELSKAIKKMISKNTAPGPDGTPGKAMSLALSVLHEEMIETLNKCLREGIIPKCWKESRLVLIQKPGKEPNSPAAFRPICLMNEAGKICERILMTRITEHLNTIGPNLHNHQYGFRQKRSTIDAIARVVTIIENTIKQNGVALAVAVDVANAFNSLPRRAIREGLERHQLPGYLKKIIGSYLTGRTWYNKVVYKDKNGYTHREVNRGVPQGSVLGPLLWNLGYDEVLHAPLPLGVYVTCYADDTLLIACGRKWNRTIRLMEVGLAALVQRISALGLGGNSAKDEGCMVSWATPKPAPTTIMGCDGGGEDSSRTTTEIPGGSA